MDNSKNSHGKAKEITTLVILPKTEELEKMNELQTSLKGLRKLQISLMDHMAKRRKKGIFINLAYLFDASL